MSWHKFSLSAATQRSFLTITLHCGCCLSKPLSFWGWKCNLFLEKKPKLKKEFLKLFISAESTGLLFGMWGWYYAEIASRLSALWHDGEYCPYMHSYFNITFMNLNHFLCCFISPWTCSFVAFLHITPSHTQSFFFTSHSLAFNLFVGSFF